MSSISESITSMYMKRQYMGAIARGMERLDQKRPGWHWEIEPELLNMGSCSLCVLGQVFGDYGRGLYALAVNNEIHADPNRLGFDGNTPTELWRDAILARQEAIDED